MMDARVALRVAACNGQRVVCGPIVSDDNLKVAESLAEQ
jgi:hypothetical protein